MGISIQPKELDPQDLASQRYTWFGLPVSKIGTSWDAFRLCERRGILLRVQSCQSPPLSCRDTR